MDIIKELIEEVLYLKKIGNNGRIEFKSNPVDRILIKTFSKKSSIVSLLLKSKEIKEELNNMSIKDNNQTTDEDFIKDSILK